MSDNQKRPRQHLDSPAGDIAEGARAIAEVVFDDDSPQSVKRIFYLAERRLIPVGKLGGKLIASKKKLRQHIDSLTSGKV
jgi:hypothetical protein